MLQRLLIILLATIMLSAASCGGGGAAPGGGGVPPGGTTGDPSINADEQTMLNMHNGTRGALGLAQLTVNPLLCQIAQNQADYQLSINTMTHSDASGGNVGTRAIAVGYATGSYVVGENVAYGINVGLNDIYNGWLNSPSHYANITDNRFFDIGLGQATSGTTQYWCITFGDT